jgi:hypothetical protein
MAKGASRRVLHLTTMDKSVPPADHAHAPTKSGQPRTALITPSISPPRIFPALSSSWRSSEPPPPAKRPRLAATPSSSFSRASSTAVDPYAELDKARRDSSKRVLDVWAQLAERYSRNIDEDDIVDISTGKVIHDRGVLRSLNQNVNFGDFTNAQDVPGEDENEHEASSEGGGADAEEDVDELDILDPQTDMREEMSKAMRLISPVRELDPADAADLKEFLEQEQQWKEQFGDPDEYIQASEHVSGSRGRSIRRGSTVTDELGDTSEADRTVDEGRETRHGSLSRQSDDLEGSGVSYAGEFSDDSADEFGAWQEDEASAVYRVSDDEESGARASSGSPGTYKTLLNSDDVIEIPDSPPPSSSPIWPASDLPGPSTSPVRGRASPTPSAKTQNRSLSRPPRRNMSPPAPIVAASGHMLSGRQQSLASKPRPPKASDKLSKPVLQLQTPPRSASLPSVDDVRNSDSILRTETVARPKPRPIFRAKAVNSASGPGSSIPLNSPVSTLKLPRTASLPASGISREASTILRSWHSKQKDQDRNTDVPTTPPFSRGNSPQKPELGPPKAYPPKAKSLGPPSDLPGNDRRANHVLPKKSVRRHFLPWPSCH